MNFENIVVHNIMKGMGQVPVDNNVENWLAIRDFVPKYTGRKNSNLIQTDTNEKKIRLDFNSIKGDISVSMQFNESTPLKDAFKQFADKKRIPNDLLQKIKFMCDGNGYTVNSQGNIKENKFRDKSRILVNIPD